MRLSVSLSVSVCACLRMCICSLVMLWSSHKAERHKNLSILYLFFRMIPVQRIIVSMPNILISAFMEQFFRKAWRSSNFDLSQPYNESNHGQTNVITCEELFLPPASRLLSISKSLPKFQSEVHVRYTVQKGYNSQLWTTYVTLYTNKTFSRKIDDKAPNFSGLNVCKVWSSKMSSRRQAVREKKNAIFKPNQCRQ